MLKCKTKDVLPQLVGAIYGSLHLILFVIAWIWCMLTIGKNQAFRRHAGRCEKQIIDILKDFVAKRKIMVPMLSLFIPNNQYSDNK